MSLTTKENRFFSRKVQHWSAFKDENKNNIKNDQPKSKPCELIFHSSSIFSISFDTENFINNSDNRIEFNQSVSNSGWIKLTT